MPEHPDTSEDVTLNGKAKPEWMAAPKASDQRASDPT
jgi:hypothetical protein